MKTITIAGKKMDIRASNMALLYYKREFKTSLLLDYINMLNRLAYDATALDEIELLQFIYAMNKASDTSITDFNSWFNELDAIDMTSNIDEWYKVIEYMQDFLPEDNNQKKKK